MLSYVIGQDSFPKNITLPESFMYNHNFLEDNYEEDVEGDCGKTL